MEREIRYCAGEDGVRIPYTVLGRGPLLLYLPPWGASNPELDFRRAEGRAFFEELASVRTLVYLTRRSVSARDAAGTAHEFSRQLGDIPAVLRALGSSACDIFAVDDGTALALAFAADHTDLVHHLVLWAPYARTRGSSDSAIAGLIGMTRSNWPLVRRMFGDLNFPSGPSEMRAWFANYHEKSLTAEITARYLAISADCDQRSFLSSLSVPTLILHRAGDRVVARRAARSVASQIVNARFLTLDGDIHLPAFGDTAYLVAVKAFLEDRAITSTDTRPSEVWPPGTAVILFTDIVNSTPLTERMGDTAFRDASRRIDDGVRAAIRAAGGTPVAGKVLGDGVMGVFASAAQAIRAAQRCVEASGDLPMHIGLHAGDVIREGDNVYGGAVNIASRICGLCDPGEILVSATVRDLARTSAGVTFEDRGDQILKGIADPMRVFAVRPGQ